MAKSTAERQAAYRARRSERMEDRLSVELPVDVRHGLVELAEYHSISLKEVLVGLIRSAHINQFGKTTEQAYQAWADAEARLFLEEVKPKKR